MYTPRRLLSAGLLLTGTWALSAHGQTAPAKVISSSAAAPEEETILLSPFEVNTTRDVGYLAGNTLAGSRLNTALKDTGAAISVLTPEFLSDLGATSMRDVILFSNNAVPDVGDAAPNFNGNPLLEQGEWRLRIRGLPASYARNFFTWETSSDFFNVERVDQARGPNSILFGFGAAGGIVNTTTKQASLNKDFGSLNLLVGSWDRYRAAVDANYVLIPKKLALRVNAVGENGNSWRQFEMDRARRVHLAGKYQITNTSSLKAEVELGRVHDNIARPWLAIDQSAAWRAANRPTYDAAQWSSTIVTQTWSEHLVYIDNTKSLADWKNLPFSYSATQNWGHLAMTPQNLAIVPIDSNLQGPAATRETKYQTYSAFYENQVSEQFSFEIAYNHQRTNFLGYDPNAGTLTRFGYLGDATELWGDASSVLPTGGANPNAGKLYVENNWTRRKLHTNTDRIRGTTAYEFEAGKFGKHRLAGLYEHSWRTYYRQEDAEVFLGSPFGAEAEFDGNRVFRRHYFQEGNASDIRVPTWQDSLVNVTDPISGRQLTSGWVPNQLINNSKEGQNTFLAALQSHFISDHLVTTLGYRIDVLDYSTAPTVRDSATGVFRLDRAHPFETTFRARTLNAGAVYHVTDQFSFFANTSSSRDVPNLNQRIIGASLPPMPKATGTDFGLKLDLFHSKVYATIDYYTTKLDDTTEWGNVAGQIATSNRILAALRSANLITGSEQSARTLDANAYLEDRKADGWEFSVVANPTSNWRVTANFSINHVVKENIMSEVVSWAQTNQAFWLSKAPGTFLLGGGDWDTLGNQIGWMNDYIKGETDFNGRSARGERRYGANLFTRYTFDHGALKGFFVGGGGRYQSRNIISTDTRGDPIYGRTLALVDALVGYEFKPALFSRRIPVELQLNVSNVFDSDKYQIYTVAWWDHSVPERIGLQEPRRFTLTARFSY